jgi:tRNA(Ile)-lysidine synthase
MAPLAPTKKPPKINATLALQGLADAAAHDWVVGLSGGRDSVALLNVLISARKATPGKLRAVHVHHGLSPNADAWAAFCESLCATLNVPITVTRVQVDVRPRMSVEAQAREARYFALKNTYDANEIVALAHHADDQIESCLLQLLRGAGPRGLAAMPLFAPANTKRPPLWRPLLGVTREQIDEYVEHHALTHIEDESNTNTRFKRNALRADVLPVLAKHFPAYRTSILRAIEHQQAVVAMLDDATVESAHLSTLPLARLRETNAAQAAEHLRRWLQAQGFPMPPATRTREAVRQLRALTTDQRFRLQLADGWALVVERDELHARPLAA